MATTSVRCPKPKPPHLPARTSSQGVWVELELLAQLPALAEQFLHPGHLSPRLLRRLVLPSPQREELPGLFHAPNQHEGDSPFCVIQRLLDERGPPLDELLLAARPNRPLVRAVGLACHLHLLSSFRSPRTRAYNNPLHHMHDATEERCDASPLSYSWINFGGSTFYKVG
jgi:hypothetical protein